MLNCHFPVDGIGARVAVPRIPNLMWSATNHNIRGPSHSVLNKDEYRARYSGLVKAYEDVKAQLDEVEAQRQKKLKRQQQMEAFLAEIRKQPVVITKFDERL